MPLIDRRSPLTSANARAADVAARMVEHVIPIQQQKMMSAFRVQGIQGILYSQLTQGLRCTCNTESHEVARLSPDGKAAPGIINRVLTGNSNFGVGDYRATPEDEFDEFDDAPTSPNNPFNQWMGDLNTKHNTQSDDAEVDDDGQSSPDLDEMLDGFDLSAVGYSDVSCPICFGSGYVGGYSVFRAFRRVIVPSELTTGAVLDLPRFELTPGVHNINLVLPMGAVRLDVLRAMCGDQIVPAEFKIDGSSVSGSMSVLNRCDGRPHTLSIVCNTNLTHVEVQLALSDEPIYLEIPKLTRNADISFLEQQEPFQILVSPDVPILKSLDVIAESQLGKLLIVQSVNPWNTRNRQMLGHEIQVRVAQPQELYRLLPLRSRVTGQKTTNVAQPARTVSQSGVIPQTKGFTF